MLCGPLNTHGKTLIYQDADADGDGISSSSTRALVVLGMYPLHRAERTPHFLHKHLAISFLFFERGGVDELKIDGGL